MTKQSNQNRLISIANIHKRNFKDFIRKGKQEFYLLSQVNKKAKRLIIFFIEGPWQKAMNEKISGGITSIESIYQRTKEFKEVHKAEAVLCTLSGNRLFNFTTFDSASRIIYSDQLKSFSNLSDVLIHIPEYLIPELLYQLESGELQTILKSKNYQLNILNQNIDLMPSPAVVNKLLPYFNTVTQTTAHKRYSSEGFLQKYNIPFHFFSARIDISQYQFVDVAEKDKLILFSPDDNEKNEKVKKILMTAMPDYRFQTIQDLTYSEYKSLIGKAKFCFTFGEGLDGYYVEPFFCGTVSFAVYNEKFFTEDYKKMPSLFSTEESLYSHVVSTIFKLQDPHEYRKAVETTNKLLTKEYNYDSYVNNIKSYYQNYFS